MLGIPAGYSSFCTRGYSDRLNYLEFEYQLAKSIAGENNILFVVYGGGSVCREWAKQHGCIYVNPIITIKNKIKALKKIEESIASVQQTTNKLYNNQVENFQQLIQ